MSPDGERKFRDFAESVEEKDAIQQDVKKIFDTFGKTDLETCEAVCRGRAFNHFDYMLFQGMAQLSGNKVYVLTMNGMRKIYSRVGGYYFMDERARQLALQFYRDLLDIAINGRHQDVAERIKQYGRECGALWLLTAKPLPN